MPSGDDTADQTTLVEDWPRRERLADMLRTQLRRRDARDAEARESPDWYLANERLDLVNGRLLLLTGAGELPLESIGAGVEADIDSIPEDDEAFRDAVIASLRTALSVRAHAGPDELTEERIAVSDAAIASALAAVARARASLRGTYPGVSLDASVTSPRRVIDVLARRAG